MRQHHRKCVPTRIFNFLLFRRFENISQHTLVSKKKKQKYTHQRSSSSSSLPTRAGAFFEYSLSLSSARVSRESA